MNRGYLQRTEETRIEFAPELPTREERKKKALEYGLYAKLPFWVFDTGVWTVLRRNTVKVLGVLCRYAGINNGIGRISNNTIKKLSGIKRVTQAMKELEFFGIITRWKGRQNGYWKRYYQIQRHPPSDLEELKGKIKIHEPVISNRKKHGVYLQDGKTGKFIKPN